MDPKEKKLKKDDDLKNESVDNDLTLPGLGDDFEDDFLPGMFEDDDFTLGDDISSISDDDDFLPGLDDDEMLPGIEDVDVIEEVVEEDDDVLPELEDEEVVEEIIEEDDDILPGLEDEEVVEEIIEEDDDVLPGLEDEEVVEKIIEEDDDVLPGLEVEEEIEEIIEEDDDVLPGLEDEEVVEEIIEEDDDVLPGLEVEEEIEEIIEEDDDVLPGLEVEEEIEEIIEEDDDVLPGLDAEEEIEEIIEEDDDVLPGLEIEEEIEELDENEEYEIIEEDELDSLEEVSEDEVIEELDEDEEYEIIEIGEDEELPEGEEYEIIEEVVEETEDAEEVIEEVDDTVEEDDEYEIIEIEDGEELPEGEDYEIIEEIIEEVEPVEEAETIEEIDETEVEVTEEVVEDAIEEITEEVSEVEDTEEAVEVEEELVEEVEETEVAEDKTEEVIEEIEEVEVVEESKDDSELVDDILASDTSDELAEEIEEVEEVETVEEVVDAESESEEDDDEYYYYSDEEEEEPEEEEEEEEEAEEESIYPDELVDIELECIYIGLLFNNPKAMSRFYFIYEDCRFSDDELMNLYKIVLFRDGEQYAPAIAKDKYQLPRETPNTYELKLKVRKIAAAKDYNLEQVYMKLKKLFILKKNYLSAPTSAIQEKILEIQNYELYADMTVEEVESALEQITVTTGLSQGRLNDDVTSFLLAGDNELSNGISIPFNILSTVFKGLRKGETMCYAMPSNSGKSRFTINLAAYISFIHKQKVLIISNEMSEEKMKLCMITTILNNPEIQELHGQKITVSEGELLELKFRPDKGKRVKVDENGYILRKDDETQEEYVARLEKNSSVFRQTLKVTEWVNTQLNNSIFFIHITEHTNDDLKKIIMNFYYKEGIQYMFYDTLKADTANIGSSDEVKKTATILSNLAQKFKIFIASSMQLLESNTLPVNLTINDMSASKTAKEVLDTLCLIKQISRQSLHKYEYADTDQFDKCYEIDVPKDTDVRFYACVVDKNRAGAKPTVIFRLNLAYNRWEELGHVRLKQSELLED